MGTRTVCANVDVLRCYMRYYVTKKLPGGYCDANEWSEANNEFDPRTFQGFLWKNNP